LGPASDPERREPSTVVGRLIHRDEERGLLQQDPGGLVGEYRLLIEGLLATLTGDNHARCVEIASLPDLIRGYEEVKLASVERYRARVRELTAAPTLARP
jgi:hypothetical protein